MGTSVMRTETESFIFTIVLALQNEEWNKKRPAQHLYIGSAFRSLFALTHRSRRQTIADVYVAFTSIVTYTLEEEFFFLEIYCRSAFRSTQKVTAGGSSAPGNNKVRKREVFFFTFFFWCCGKASPVTHSAVLSSVPVTPKIINTGTMLGINNSRTQEP